jgi:hypothetical protein
VAPAANTKQQTSARESPRDKMIAEFIEVNEEIRELQKKQQIAQPELKLSEIFTTDDFLGTSDEKLATVLREQKESLAEWQMEVNPRKPVAAAARPHKPVAAAARPHKPVAAAARPTDDAPVAAAAPQAAAAPPAATAHQADNNMAKQLESFQRLLVTVVDQQEAQKAMMMKIAGKVCNDATMPEDDDAASDGEGSNSEDEDNDATMPEAVE